MATISIDSVDYDSYGTVADADAYLNVASHATAWQALTSSTADVKTKGMALITATRLLDRQQWKDDYDTFAERAVVENIVSACYELANLIISGEDVQTKQNTAQTIQTLKAEGAMITYFRGAEGYPLRFPLTVMELISEYLKSDLASSVIGISVSGVDGTSATENDYTFSDF